MREVCGHKVGVGVCGGAGCGAWFVCGVAVVSQDAGNRPLPVPPAVPLHQCPLPTPYHTPPPPLGPRLQAQEVHADLRKWMAETVSAEAAAATRIIYGGSGALPAACLRYLAAWLLAAWLPAIACYRLPAACYTQMQILVECLWLTA